LLLLRQGDVLTGLHRESHSPIPSWDSSPGPGKWWRGYCVVLCGDALFASARTERLDILAGGVSQRRVNFLRRDISMCDTPSLKSAIAAPMKTPGTYTASSGNARSKFFFTTKPPQQANEVRRSNTMRRQEEAASPPNARKRLRYDPGRDGNG
jgi:hypothetical protein